MKPEPQWDDLKYLESIERLGGVKAAARDLGVSPSTVYRRVATLERALGHVCLIRGPSGDLLTDAGRAAATVGRKTRKAVAELDSVLRATDSRTEGDVSFTTVEALRPFVAPVLVELTRHAPGLRLTLHFADSGPSVRDREVDLALGVMKRPPAGCWGKRLTTLPVGVFGTPAALAQEPRRWVTRSRAEQTAPEFAWEQLHARHVAVTAPFASMVEFVAQGAGLGVLPRLVANRLGLAEAVEFRESTRHLERPLWLLTHADLRKTPRVVAVMRAVQSAFVSPQAA